jgi:uncharacterized iron-regulated protein
MRVGASAFRFIALACIAAAVAATCPVVGGEPTNYAWESRLQGDRIALLGELHDSAALQSLRFQILKRAVVAGWRPEIAMEQFDRERQNDINEARLKRPADADYLIDHATGRAGRRASGWNWTYYRPYVALALQYQLPLIAANLSRTDAERIVSHGYVSVFDSATIRSLGLDRATPELLRLQEKEINEGHCHMLPGTLLPGMARAQLARDAWMAAVLRAHSASGVVLLAGDGHVRRDLGVPQWLKSVGPSRVLSVGFVERGTSDPPASAFDALVTAKPAVRPDPCAALRPTQSRWHPLFTQPF